jgi:hypothetical protein
VDDVGVNTALKIALQKKNLALVCTKALLQSVNLYIAIFEKIVILYSKHTTSLAYQ